MTIRLTVEALARIEARVGKDRIAVFVRAAVDEKLARLEQAERGK